MLRRLRIQSLGVIADAEVEFGPGLNVITGETGAGKTMVVAGLGLLLGARADAQQVRDGQDSAVIEGEIDVGEDHPAAVRAAEAGGEVADGVLLARTIAASGRSRAHVGGRSAPIGVLVDVGEHLVAVHGQADQWRLRDVVQHRLLLDAFGGADVRTALSTYHCHFDRWQTLRHELDGLSAAANERAREAQVLRLALQEIDTVSPQVGEEDELAVQAERLGHADGLRRVADTAHHALAGEDGQPGANPALDVLSQASAELLTVSDHDPVLGALAQRLAEVHVLAADIASELAGYAESIDIDPERLAQVHQRRATLTALLRHYGSTSSEVLAWAHEAAARLQDLESSDQQIVDLQGSVETHRELVATAAATLSAARGRAAERLGEGVSAELTRLAMGGARVCVAVTSRLAQARVGESETGQSLGAGDQAASDVVEIDGVRVHPRRSGTDDIEIQLAANTGSRPRSITRAVSGGELSRVMLALELVCASDPVPTYVFDEVDAGVGGGAAVELGARLAELAKTAQVLVVTHLGQVAAYADRHIVVDKTSDAQVTSSAVRVLTGPEREAELARMLGGDPTSRAGLDHARELMSRHRVD